MNFNKKKFTSTANKTKTNNKSKNVYVFGFNKDDGISAKIFVNNVLKSEKISNNVVTINEKPESNDVIVTIRLSNERDLNWLLSKRKYGQYQNRPIYFLPTNIIDFDPYKTLWLVNCPENATAANIDVELSKSAKVDLVQILKLSKYPGKLFAKIQFSTQSDANTALRSGFNYRGATLIKLRDYQKIPSPFQIPKSNSKGEPSPAPACNKPKTTWENLTIDVPKPKPSPDSRAKQMLKECIQKANGMNIIDYLHSQYHKTVFGNMI